MFSIINYSTVATVGRRISAFMLFIAAILLSGETLTGDIFAATPLRGAYFATNGRGAVDRARVYFDRTLEISEIPDSIAFFWPNTKGQVRLVKKQEMTADPIAMNVLTVSIPTPFSDCVTRYTDSNAGLGKTFWSNPLTPDAQSVQFQFDMADSVGPLIASAVLIERLAAGNDSLILTFTEPVPRESVKEHGLTLLKRQGDGSFVPVVLNIIRAEPDEYGAIAVVINDLGNDNALKAGDSLRITPTGPIVDASGNKAHPLNRAVVLTLKKIAPDIVSARYEDRNADGRIETVRVTFNKAVTPGEMVMQFRLDNSMSTGGADSTEFTVGGPTTIDVNIAGLFSEAALKDKTSGTLNVTVSFENYEMNNVKNRLATDGAAPVLTAFEYHQGCAIYPDTGFAPDTIFATYSEPLKNPPRGNLPFSIADSTGNSFTIAAFYLNQSRNKYVFLVDSPTRYRKPDLLNSTIPKDSAWINIVVDPAIMVVDVSLNYQNNPSNKRVPVVFLARTNTITDSTDIVIDQPFPLACCGCGSGTGLALIPPLFFYSRRRLKKKTKQE